jgi:hypothetical protein
MSELEYRILEPKEWDKLRQFFEGENAFVPPPELGVASVAVSNGELAASLVLQMVSYLGPLKVREGCESRINYRRLKANIDNIFKSGKRGPLIINGYIALPQKREVAELAKATGMQELTPPAVLVECFDEAARGALSAS